jgi:hypothetical protein
MSPLLCAPVHDLCKDEEMSCFGELQGAKPKLEAGDLGWFCLRHRSLKQGISSPYKDRE